ncbi:MULTISPECIES: YnfA family protein [unclassified Enterococcus]|uniref:YnfA family protein n=1 Tax=unclassified Enterococcus TaxID=2608891 RepID=UPI001555C829|nr:MULTISPECIES: YnfA family protein [unclassified Enterococcus]MBS7577251.1 YnfA family protein [Enterococcus sp. MMGLQ5-2]MBS7584656.1 YnfA family protein [Enterococcus sp. MMGLQ5-1]NPD12511.1 YnfA family protein [Enterococcus sp. MMGLQ5-1]NPD37085.1 YnfA family protein [Enterococcus sp. MMGLQ5-2]
MQAFFLFIVAGLAEIGGGYLIWQWLRADKTGLLGFLGGILLILYGVIATYQKFPDFSRVYAAYGGIFIVLSLLWGWLFDKKTPDFYDCLGAIFCLIGAIIILYAPRQ